MTYHRWIILGLSLALPSTTGCGDGDSMTSEGSATMASSGIATEDPTTAGPSTMSESESETDGSGAETAGETMTTDTSDTSNTTDPTDTTDTTDSDTTDSDTTDTTDSDTTVGTTDDPTTTSDSDSDTSDSDTGEPECGNLLVTYRDFMPLHEDFGCHMSGNFAYPGLVMPTLGNQSKPEYNPNPPAPPNGWTGTQPQITNGSTFSQWYNTVDGINIEIQGELELTEIMPGVYSFASDAFYPLTDMGFGNNTTPNWAGQTYPDHNGAFTSEIHTNFIYQPGQEFTFIGDDDVWVFIDGNLALDLGGLHPPDQDTIILDNLGLTQGQNYTLDVFHAERCGSGSNFRIDTSINCFIPE